MWSSFMDVELLKRNTIFEFGINDFKIGFGHFKAYGW